MTDRSSSRRLTLIIGAIVVVVFLVLMYTVVFEGCQEPDTRGDVVSPVEDGVGAPGTQD